MSDQLSLDPEGMKGGLRMAPAEIPDAFSMNIPPRWIFRLRMFGWVVIAVAVFIGYAGYSKLTVDVASGEESFVNGPGFMRFSKSSGLDGVVLKSARMWGKLLGREMPVTVSTAEKPIKVKTEDVSADAPTMSDVSETDSREASETEMREITEEEILQAEKAAAEAVAAMAKAADEAAKAAAEAARAMAKDIEKSGLPLLESEKEEKLCPSIPDVPWWENKTHEESIEYVAANFEGDWRPYINKWERHLTKVIDVFVAKKKVKIPVTGDILGGEELANYISQVEGRISAIHCLARNAKPGKAAS